MLRNFRCVPVREQTVRTEIFVHLHEMRLALWLFSCAAYARFTVANDPARYVDPAGLDERPQPQNHRSWVATGIGDESRCRQRRCIQLGKAVHGFLQNFACGRGEFVPGLKCLWLVKTERSAQIDDSQFRICCKKLRYELQ